MTRVLVALIAAFSLPGLLLALVHFAQQVGHAPGFAAVALGVALGVVLEAGLVRRFPRAEMFEHELSHAIAALLLFRRVKRFVVGPQGGGVEFSDGFLGRIGADLIAFAPYVAPTLTLGLILVRPQFRPVPACFDLAVGITYSWYLGSTVREIARNWNKNTFVSVTTHGPVRSDIGERGYLYSGLLITTGILLMNGLTMALFVHGYAGVMYWSDALRNTITHLIAALPQDVSWVKDVE